MCKISIIVPVHRAESYIGKCARSLFEQTLNDMEYIFVDDCSPDRSIDILKETLKEYPERKEQVKTIRMASNGGPGEARNAGLSVASGEYVAFVDSDDTVEKDYCKVLYETAKDSDAEISFCNAFLIDASGRRVLSNPSSGNKRKFLVSMKSYLWTFCFRKDFILKNQLAFPPYHCAEDSCFILSSILCASRIASTPLCLYNYYIRTSSVSNKKDPQRYRQRISSFKALVDFARNRGLYRPYRFELWIIMIKKGYLLALRDLLEN